MVALQREHVDMRHTVLHTVGEYFACGCPRLTTVMLPDTVTEVGVGFLDGCGRVVTSGSTTVQAATKKHKKDIVFLITH